MFSSVLHELHSVGKVNGVLCSLMKHVVVSVFTHGLSTIAWKLPISWMMILQCCERHLGECKVSLFFLLLCENVYYQKNRHTMNSKHNLEAPSHSNKYLLNKLLSKKRLPTKKQKINTNSIIIRMLKGRAIFTLWLFQGSFIATSITFLYSFNMIDLGISLFT